MNIDNLTIAQAREIAAMFGVASTAPSCDAASEIKGHDRIPVVICTDKRGVVFGYTDNANSRPIKVEQARMALYWSSDVGGVFGLAEKGPTSGCKISAIASSLTLEGVTAVFSVDPTAEKAWNGAKVQGR